MAGTEIPKSKGGGARGVEGGGGGGSGWTTASATLSPRHLNDFRIQMGNDESHFHVPVINSEGQSHKTVPQNHKFFKRKESRSVESNRRRPLTSLTPYRWAILANHFV